ncbi:hypothetical protein VN1286_04760 [Helicobacter pylori]|nr:hypothetical protein VN1286_04760 [Helicobacter pylori]
MENTGNKKNNILCYNETFKWCAKNANQNTKKGLIIYGKQDKQQPSVFRAQRIAQHHLESG